MTREEKTGDKNATAKAMTTKRWLLEAVERLRNTKELGRDQEAFR